MSEFLDQLHLFGDEFDEFEEANWNGLERRIATKKELRSLRKFHSGGFEKWPEMNDDCKQIVVGFLPFRARMRLGVCSKSDLQLVEKTPVRIDRMTIEDDGWPSRWKEDNFQVKIVLIDEELEKEKEYFFIFSQLGDNVEIRRKWDDHEPIIIPKSNYYDEGVKFAEKWLKKGRYGVRDLTVATVKSAYPFESSEIRFLPNVKEARIYAKNENEMTWWLERLPEQLRSLQLYTSLCDSERFCLSPDFLARPQVRAAKEFHTSLKAAFTDSDLLSLKNLDCRFRNIHVTEQGINDFLRKWQNGQGVAGFRSLEIRDFELANPRILVENLGAQHWDFGMTNDQLPQHWPLCNVYLIPSRVNPSESVTLRYSEDFEVFIRTGQANRVDDVTHAEYLLWKPRNRVF